MTGGGSGRLSRWGRWRRISTACSDGFIRSSSRYHRVVTHSILGLILIALACAGLARVWPEQLLLPFMRTKQPPEAKLIRPAFKRLLAFAALAVGMHFIGDWITDWGVWPFWPWSMQDCKLARVNSLEPALLGITVSAWAVQHWLIVHGRRKAAWLTAVVWLMISALYVAVRIQLFGRPFI
ncbi:metal-dependent hydrolase [Candidatus Sumerlaeota bacterium]|nr:metal-dependent hydrolase [Candidatus Sumerlaeota bacterium]